jgi:hypothetical protein
MRSVRTQEVLSVLSTEWQSSTAIRKLTGNTACTAHVLPQLLAEGVVERRGNGFVGDPYEWRLRAPADHQASA